jgi:hypothetical protein
MRAERKETEAMKEGTVGRRVSIVFEETGGAAFNVYLDGATKGINQGDPGDDLSPANFYASRMLTIVVGHLQKVGAFKSATRRS